MLMHHTQTVQLFGNIFALSNSVWTRAVCIKISGGGGNRKGFEVWLLSGEKTLMICRAVLTEYRSVRQTDGQTERRTDRQTFFHSTVHAMHTRRAVKTKQVIVWLLALNLSLIVTPIFIARQHTHARYRYSKSVRPSVTFRYQMKTT